MAGKMRSPNYPALSLARALEAADKLWKAEKRTPVSIEAAVKGLGFQTLSGPARVAIGTLRQYGLVDKTDKGHVRLSDLAVKVLHGSPEDKAAGLRQAATTPKLFKELAQSHADGSEAAIQSYLITKKDFAEDGARKAARAFRDTFKLANSEASGYTLNGGHETPEDRSVVDTGQISRDAVPATVGGKTQGEQEVLQQRVAPDCVARVLFQGRATQEAVDKLIAYLNLMRDTLPSGKGHLADIGTAIASRA